MVREPLNKFLAPTLGIAFVIGVIGAVSLWVGQPLLIPSLGSAIFLQLMTPEEPSARTWNTAVGQLAGAGCGFGAVALLGVAGKSHFMVGSALLAARVGAAVLAVFGTAIIQYLLDAVSAAGGATALIVAVGAETTSPDGAVRLVAGIVLVTALGEPIRRWIVRRR